MVRIYSSFEQLKEAKYYDLLKKERSDEPIRGPVRDAVIFSLLGNSGLGIYEACEGLLDFLDIYGKRPEAVRTEGLELFVKAFEKNPEAVRNYLLNPKRLID